MAFAYGGHSAAKLIHFAFTLAMIPLMIATARRLGFDGAPAARSSTAPVVGVCGASAYNDVALAFYILAVFYFAACAFEFTSCRPAGWILLRGEAPRNPDGSRCLVLSLDPASMARSGLFACEPTSMMAPWMARTAWMSGNPFAPLFNEWFPNPTSIAPQRSSPRAPQLRCQVAGASWEVTVRGFRTGDGHRSTHSALPSHCWPYAQAGQQLLLAALVAAIPWWANAGTRFLIPAMVFLALALVLSMPKDWLGVWLPCRQSSAEPQLAGLYAAKGAWRLHGFPGKRPCVCRTEQYLSQSLGIRIAEMLRAPPKPEIEFWTWLPYPRLM